MPGRVLNDFLGCWRVERALHHADGQTASFQGAAVWARSPLGAGYCETGFLILQGGERFAAERRYDWDKDLNVFFDDGRFFHQVPALGGEAAHWCDPDQYDVSYDFSDWPRWQAIWRVSGPRKAYTSETWYAPKA